MFDQTLDDGQLTGDRRAPQWAHVVNRAVVGHFVDTLLFNIRVTLLNKVFHYLDVAFLAGDE